MKPRQKAKVYGAIAIITILLLAGALYFSHSSMPNLKPAAITSISEIKEGTIKDGKLVGAKIVVSGTASLTDDELLIKTKGTEWKIGDYTIIPNKNIVIKIKSNGAYAETPLKNHIKTYWQPTFSNILSITALEGETWNIFTPSVINVYADESEYPTTLISSKYLEDIGQSMIPISDNGIKAQQTSIAFIGSQWIYTASDIVIATAPDYKSDYLPTDYKLTTYIFRKTAFDDAVSVFYDNYGSKTTTVFNNPAMVLWTGYDEYKTIPVPFVTNQLCSGFVKKCKVWDGLYKIATRLDSVPSFDLTYDETPTADSPHGLVRANNIAFSANYIIEIPSEIVDSIAVLKGVGVPEIISIDAPQSVRADSTSYQQVNVIVRNNGDDDGFNIQPISKGGKLIFTPSSYTSYPIEAGKQVTFQFGIAVAGTETFVNVKEDVKIDARANHNPVKATKDVQIGVEYGNAPKGQPTVVPKSTSTLPKKPAGEGKAWYEEWYVFVLMGLILMLAYFVYEGKKKK